MTMRMHRTVITLISLIAAAATPAQAGHPFLSHTASGSGTAHVESETPVFDSDVTTDPDDPVMEFHAINSETVARFDSQAVSHVETPPSGGLTLQWTASLLVLYDRLIAPGFPPGGGGGDGQISAIVEFAMPSDEVEWTYSLDEELLGYTGTVHLLAENTTQSQVLLDVSAPAGGTLPLAGVAGDLIRISVESSASGVSPPDAQDEGYRMNLLMQFTNVGDCNGNGVTDHQEVLDGSGFDCNTNGVLDSCDLASGTSLDTDGDGIPDECQEPATKGSDDVCIGGANAGAGCGQNSECASGVCRLKNRYITAEIPATATWHGLKVTMVSIDADSVATPANYNGTDRWVGAPALGISDGAGRPTFNAARTQCSFFSTNWSAVGRLHIYGDVIVPGSLYDLRSCSSQTTCSSALRIGTGEFGDIILPTPVANFQDTFSIVLNFQGDPTRPSKTRADLVASVLNPTNAASINFTDVGASVAAFQLRKYRQVVTTPPATCP